MGVALLLALLLIVPVTIFRGYVLSQLWHWFVVPLGVTDIGIAWAIGLSVLVTLFTFRYDIQTDKDMQGWTGAIVGFIIVLISWGMGALVHLFM